MGSATADSVSKGFMAGWGRVDFTPAESVPLAGYTHLTDRMSSGVHDPLFARAVAFTQEGGPSVALVVYDMVIVTEDLYQGLKARFAGTDFAIMCAATHTHSAPGGFWNALLGRAFLGRFRKGALEHLIDVGESAIRQAMAGLAPAVVSSGTVTIPGLNGNRRHHGGLVDEELQVIRVAKPGSDAILFSYPGHPVIAAEREHNLISADFPGLAVARIEQQFDFAMYMAGALGGVDVKFPQTPVPLDDNLEMMAAPIAGAAVSVAHAISTALAVPSEAASNRPVLAHSVREILFDRPRVRWSYDDDRKPLDFILDSLANRLARPVPRVARVEGFRLGDMVIVGFPADLGVGLSMRVKELAVGMGFRNAITMSESGSCVGYIHHPDDYAKTPPDDGDAIQMGRYENAMNFFGHESGLKFLNAASEVLKELA